MADGEDDSLIIEPDEGEQPEIEGEEQAGEQQPGDEGEGEPEILFGDEAAPASGERETGLVRHLREQLREKERRLAEAERRQPTVELGPKPTLAGCEFDEERYEAELDAWKGREAQAKAAETAEQEQARQAREEWARDEQSHRDKRARLSFADIDEAESVALGSLSQVQYAAIVMAADDSAKVLYALGKRPDKLAELSQIKNPLKLAAAVVRLEGGLKVMPRRSVTVPEEVASGSAAMNLGKDKQEERLEKEADRTGDRTALIQYRKQKAKVA